MAQEYTTVGIVSVDGKQYVEIDGTVIFLLQEQAKTNDPSRKAVFKLISDQLLRMKEEHNEPEE